MTRRNFAITTVAVPPAVIIGFVEASRKWPTEFRFYLIISFIVFIFINIGWMISNERVGTLLVRASGLSMSFAIWSVLIGSTVYPGLFLDNFTWQDRAFSAARVFIAAFLPICGAFLAAKLARELMTRKSRTGSPRTLRRS
jgi:hypothetical protein